MGEESDSNVFNDYRWYLPGKYWSRLNGIITKALRNTTVFCN